MTKEELKSKVQYDLNNGDFCELKMYMSDLLNNSDSYEGSIHPIPEKVINEFIEFAIKYYNQGVGSNSI